MGMGMMSRWMMQCEISHGLSSFMRQEIEAIHTGFWVQALSSEALQSIGSGPSMPKWERCRAQSDYGEKFNNA